MKQAAGSQTIWRPLLFRAVHQILDDEPKILVDPVSLGLVPESSEHAIRSQTDMLCAPNARLLRSAFLLRARFAEDELATARSRGVGQYVILGAGLDTFGFRQPAYAHKLAIFEVDAPATQAVKRDLFRKTGLHVPRNVRYVAVDFEQNTIAERLVACAFDAGIPTFFSWLGVVQYLTRAAVESTLRFVASLPAGSGIVLSFNPPDDELGGDDLAEAHRSRERGASLGEPWLTRMNASAASIVLQKAGFRTIFHLTPEEAHARYFTNRSDGLRAPVFEQLITASV